MKSTRSSMEVLIVDDEPEFLDWVEEYLKTQDLTVRYARDLPRALEALSASDYRLLVVDMNIPSRESISPSLRTKVPSVDRYPGLAIAVAARNAGYEPHQVVAYTVHDDDVLDAELQKLSCRYVLKGRPEVLKRVLRASLKRP